MSHYKSKLCCTGRPNQLYCNCSTNEHAFTIVELLATIAIIAALVSLLLPSIQSSRESARRIHCTDNLRNIATALLVYHDDHSKFPCGGWGHQWVGVPERGTGPRQPGGWAYCALPYLEERPLHNLGLGLGSEAATDAYSQRLQKPISILTCPSRRSCSVWPVADKYSYVRTPRPHGNVTSVARGDYAINGGASHVINLGGPADLEQGDDPTYWKNAPNAAGFNGISHLRTAAAMRSITDGTSKTYLVGEKHVALDSYMTGTSPGDNESLYAGYCTDLHRFTGVVGNVKIEQSPFAAPLHDSSVPENSIPDHVRFGSAHSAGVNLSFCDGSAQLIDFNISPEVHLRAGHRCDSGNPLESLE